MPFKIVRTVEKGKTELCVVPSQWESGGTLKWPKKGAEKLIKYQDVNPGSDWLKMDCSVKRRNIMSYEIADAELQAMLNNTDTEKEDEQMTYRRPVQRRETVNLNVLAEQMVVQDDCGSTSTATIDCRDASELGETYILVEDNSGTQGSTMPQPNTDIQNILLNQSTLFNITNQIMETQQKIILKLASLSVQMEESFSRMENTVPLKDASSADSNSFIVKQIKNIKELEEMESLLSDNEYKNKLKKSCSFICSGGEGNGVNCAYRFIDIFFSRDFLCECSWSGSSRDEYIKISLKCYKKTLYFFFEMISHWDSSYSQEANENFFKSILKNSRKRKIVKYARVPTKRNRPKGVNSDKQQKTINDQNTIIIHPACSSKESVNNINDGEDVEEEEESLC